MIEKGVVIEMFNQYMNSIKQKSYEELEWAHEILVPFALKCKHSVFGNLTPEESMKRLAEIENTMLPVNCRIWGCKTYGDASRMNKAIVRQMDLLDED